MSDGLRRRFRVETGMGLVGAALLVLTIIRKDWIEVLFNIDPDHYSGSAEWAIAPVLLAVTVTAAAMEHREWRRRSALPA